MNHIPSNHGNKPTRTPDLSFFEVAVRQVGSPVQALAQDLIERCEAVLPGFGQAQAYWAEQLFGKHSEKQGSHATSDIAQHDMLRNFSFRGGVSRFPEHGATEHAARIDLPATAYVGMCSETMNFQELMCALEKRGLRLAPAHVLLSTLLVHFKSSSYEVDGFDGKKSRVDTSQLRLPGPSWTEDRCIIAAGGVLRDGDGLVRESLLGARTSPRKLEFFLPYVTQKMSGGWAAGTLFLLEKIPSKSSSRI